MLFLNGERDSKQGWCSEIEIKFQWFTNCLLPVQERVHIMLVAATIQLAESTLILQREETVADTIFLMSNSR